MNLLNQALLQTMREAIPADDLDELLRQLIDHVTADTGELVRRARASESREVLLLAHRLSGLAANFGCEALAGALTRVETELRADAGRLPSAETLDQVDSLARATAAALEEMIRRSRPGFGLHEGRGR